MACRPAPAVHYLQTCEGTKDTTAACVGASGDPAAAAETEAEMETEWEAEQEAHEEAWRSHVAAAGKEWVSPHLIASWLNTAVSSTCTANLTMRH